MHDVLTFAAEYTLSGFFLLNRKSRLWKDIYSSINKVVDKVYIHSSSFIYIN